jgi:2-oxoglutarate dehydrogenase E2 component (dihydrolipoamide succinyltransferase)
MKDVVMPQLGESVAEGTVTKWLVKEGDFVAEEQVLLTVATDKADTEIRAPYAGRIAKLHAKQDEVIAKGGLLCQIDETASAGAGAPAAAPAASVAAPPAASVAAPPAAPSNGPSGLASPSTRRIALEHGVDLSSVQGTGQQGRVTHDDVMRAATPPRAAAPAVAAPAAAAAPVAAAPTPTAQELSALLQVGGGFVPPIPGVGYGAYKVPPYTPRPGDEVVPFNRRRRITADHMVYSKLVSPHVVTVAEVDLFATSKLRDAHKDRLKKEGVPLTFLAFICAAVVKSLRENPQLNARVLDNSYVVLRDINLGVAVETPGGLVVPSIKHADQLSLRGIAASIDELASRARAGKVTADDLSGTSFSVSNPGLKGNLFGGAIISQPNVGILRMGEIKKRPVVVTRDGEDTIAIHPVMYMALSYDHRIIDGVLANSFLWRVADILTRAEFEVG